MSSFAEPTAEASAYTGVGIALVLVGIGVLTRNRWVYGLTAYGSPDDIDTDTESTW